MDIRKRYRWVWIGLIVMVILNLIILGSLWIRRPPFGRHRGEKAPRAHVQHMLNSELKLNGEQQQEFKELRKKYHIEIKTALERIRQNREKLYEVMATADSVQTDSLTTLIAEGHKKIETINVEHFRAMRSVLTDNQQQRFDKMIRRVINVSTGRAERPMKPPH